jgi:hypothetical protein
MDCHTPGYFFGKPDMPRHLAGSEVGFEIPGLGILHGANLTPDKETGLGALGRMKKSWRQCKSVRPDGRMLAPIMPWRALANLTKVDASAKPPRRKESRCQVPSAPSEKPTSFVMKIVPPDGK